MPIHTLVCVQRMLILFGPLVGEAVLRGPHCGLCTVTHCIENPLQSFRVTVLRVASFLVAGTPNGIKVAILAEELGIKYTNKVVDVRSGESKHEWFVKLNPNGRIPAIGTHAANPWDTYSACS